MQLGQNWEQKLNTLLKTWIELLAVCRIDDKLLAGASFDSIYLSPLTD